MLWRNISSEAWIMYATGTNLDANDKEQILITAEDVLHENKVYG